jgi:hypothetical protein
VLRLLQFYRFWQFGGIARYVTESMARHNRAGRWCGLEKSVATYPSALAACRFPVLPVCTGWLTLHWLAHRLYIFLCPAVCRSGRGIDSRLVGASCEPQDIFIDLQSPVDETAFRQS